jgi:Transposase DDE domain
MQHSALQLLELCQKHLDYDLRRQRLVVNFILALIAVRSVNLKQIAVHIGGIKPQATYRTLQRFFQGFRPDKHVFLQFLLSLLPEEPLTLVMDRTNWDFGKSHINYLVLGVLYQGTVIPLCWMLLEKTGNSSQVERVILMRCLLQVLPVERIRVFIADREFVGKDWLLYLKHQGIKRCIRVKKNGVIFPDSFGRKLEQMFANLSVGESAFKRRRYFLMGQWLYLAAVRLEHDLLIVACDDKPRRGLMFYGLRWGIETFFGNAKTRGFDLEETHMTAPEKLSMLLGLVALATLWCLRVGEAIVQREGKRAIKSHRRYERSLFRIGLDFLQGLILQHNLHLREFRFVVKVLTCT